MIITDTNKDPYAEDPYADPVVQRPTSTATTAGTATPVAPPRWIPPDPSAPAPTADTSTVAPPRTPDYTPLPTALPDGTGGIVPVPPPEIGTAAIIPGGVQTQTAPGWTPPPPPGTELGLNDAGPAGTAPTLATDIGTPPPPPPPDNGLGLNDAAPAGVAPTLDTGAGAPPPGTGLGLNDAAPAGPAPALSAPVADVATTPPPAPAAPPPTPVTTTPFGPDSNLIGSAIMPTTDPRAAAQLAAGDTGLAAQDAAPDIAAPGADPRLLKFQGMTDDLLAKLQSQPDRLALAKQYYDTFANDTEGDYNRSLNTATSEGAAHGRLGSGILTNTYGDLAERRLRDKETAKENLLNNALEGTFNDRNTLYGQVSEAEKNAFGEAGANTAAERQALQDRRALIDAHYAVANDATQQGRADRSEARGERGYQADLAQQAMMNRIQQMAAQGNLDQQSFDQLMELFGAGNTADPTSVLETGSATAGAEAAGSAADAEAIARALLARQQQNVPAGATP